MEGMRGRVGWRECQGEWVGGNARESGLEGMRGRVGWRECEEEWEIESRREGEQEIEGNGEGGRARD